MALRHLWAISLLFVFSCSERRNQSAEPAGPPPDLWAHYKVWAAEGDTVVTCLLQFYSDPRLQQTLVLADPAGVQLNGQELQVDSAGISGAYYEYQDHVANFNGRHFVRLTDANERAYIDSFSFHPFSLAAELPTELAPEDYALQLDGLPDGSLLRVVLTDTSLEGNGINEVDTVRGGRVVLPAEYFHALHSGPVIMQLNYEEERPLRSRLRGELSVSYGLNRVFNLKK